MDYIISALLVIIILVLVAGGTAMVAYNEKYTRDQLTTSCEITDTCQ